MKLHRFKSIQTDFSRSSVHYLYKTIAIHFLSVQVLNVIQSLL